MNLTRSTEIYIRDILAFMERAEEHINGIEFNDFINDSKTCDAVIRCLEVIGEASKNIPEETRKKFPQARWREMAGMRDKIIHSYFTIDYENVWLVVKEEIPKLKPLISGILSELKADDQRPGPSKHP